MANEKIVECEVVRSRLGMMTQLGGSGKVTAHLIALWKAGPPIWPCPACRNRAECATVSLILSHFPRSTDHLAMTVRSGSHAVGRSNTDDCGDPLVRN